MVQGDLWMEVSKRSHSSGDVSKRSHQARAKTQTQKSAREKPGAGRSERPLTKKTRARTKTQTAWTLEPHVCRVCFGRIVSRPSTKDAHGFVYQCTNCGAENGGRSPDVLCACGLKLRNHAPGAPLVDAGLRCQPNPDPRPDFPSLFVAAAPPP